MSTPPRMKEGASKRPAGTASTGYASQGAPTPPKLPPPPAPPKLPPLAARLPDMSDADLVSMQTNAVRIMGAEGHPKRAAAMLALPEIEAEISRRTVMLDERKKTVAEGRSAAQKAQRLAAAVTRKAKSQATPKV